MEAIRFPFVGPHAWSNILLLSASNMIPVVGPIVGLGYIFDAMEKCDPATIRALSLPEGRLFRLTPGSDQPPRSTTLDDFAAQFATCNRTLLERMWAPQVRVHKGIATLWAPYDFWLNGAFSHCGIDSFEMLKTADGWKLASGTYTVEREGCAPSPLGPPTAVRGK